MSKVPAKQSSKTPAKKPSTPSTMSEATEIESTAEDVGTVYYRAYGLYVLEERAVPALHDGLKPVQRRILHAMHTMGLNPKGNYKKCAAIVGDTMAKYHPHGDQPIYEALVNMVNPEPLVQTRNGGHTFSPIDPQGNFGAPPRKLHPAAAMRYTEARLTKLGATIFECSEVCDMIPNFSGEYTEPVLLAPRVPWLLLFGASGVAVGASTELPPHGLQNVLKVTKYVLKNGVKARLASAVEILGGPDYGHSYVTSSKEDLEAMYREGKGTIRFMCDHHIRRGKDSHELVITSYAPGFTLTSFLDKMSGLVDEGKIVACNNETDSEGPRVTVLFKDPNVIEERVLPLLRTFQHYCWNVIDKLQGDAKFMRINLLTYLNMWIEWRRVVERKMLELYKKRTDEQLAREQAKLAAAQCAETLGKIMGMKIPIEQKKLLIRKEVKYTWLAATSSTGKSVKLPQTHTLTDSQVEYLLDQKIRSMDRMNEEAQKAEVQKLHDILLSIADDLAHIDRVILGHLNRIDMLMAKEMATWSPSKLVYGEPTLEIPETESGKGFWHVNRAGYVRSYETLPTKGSKFPEGYLAPMTEELTVVREFGTAATLRSVYLSTGKIDHKDIIGIVPGNMPVLMVMDKDGNVGCIEHPPAKTKGEYWPLQIPADGGALIGAWGVRDSDVVFAFGANTWCSVQVSKLGTKRPDSLGKKLLARTRKPPAVYVVPSGGLLVANGVGVISPEKVTQQHTLFAVGKKNFIITSSGKRLEATAISAASWAASDGLIACYILR